MKKIISIALFFFFVILLDACAGQKKTAFQPVPQYDDIIPEDLFSVGDITETKEGAGNAHLPDWLLTFINGGIEEVEEMVFYRNKYCFIGINEGGNFGALSKWAGNYSVIQDFPWLAAARIEKRLISAASLYPDEEYGSFYETMVKKAFDTEYHGAFLEDTFWIKKKINRNESENSVNDTGEKYNFYVFLSIDRITMQAVIENMMTETLAVVTPTRSQNAAIKRLQQIFFTGF